MSSPCPAMPTTSVEKTSGAIRHLMRRRNRLDSTCRDEAWNTVACAPSGKRYPIAAPTNVATRTHREPAVIPDADIVNSRATLPDGPRLEHQPGPEGRVVSCPTRGAG